MSRGSVSLTEREGGRASEATFACKCSFVPFCGDQLSREIGSLLSPSFPSTRSFSSFAANQRTNEGGIATKRGGSSVMRSLHDDQVDDEWKSCLLSPSLSAYL